MEARPGDGPMPAALRSRYLQNDVAGLVCVVKALRDTPDNSAVITTIVQPALVIAGDMNLTYPRLVTLAGDLPNGKFVGLPGLTHRHELERIDLVLPPVQAFLDDVLA